MKENRKYSIRGNPVIWRLLVIFLVMTCIIGSIACYYAYQQKRVELLAELDKQLLRVVEEYKDITEDFWAIYLPIFEEEEDNEFLTYYFENEKVGKLSSMEEFELKKTLSRMAIRDEKVQWIVVYSPKRQTNYIYFPLNDLIQVLPEDFPYLDKLATKTKRMEIIPKTEMQIRETHYSNVAIVGGVPGRVSSNSIMMGYDIGYLEELCNMNGAFESLEFHVLFEGKVIFSSDNSLNLEAQVLRLGENGICEMKGEKWYIQVADEQLRGEYIFYAVKLSELLRGVSQSVGLIIIITILMSVLAVGVYLLALKSITNEVNVIRSGLDVIGQNRLDYRIEEVFDQPELRVIAKAINQMSQRLKYNIERAHEYERRQIEAELQELQSKFNPHFLYNTLEMFRLRCYQNGDEETADLISQTASIFRGFIGSKTFIPILEELSFSKRYLALFRARYGESVKVSYDIDTDVLEYGIIRSVFQPLIENYFEHGYNPANEENYFLIRGSIRDDDTILFTIEDNGFGMEEKDLKELNAKLHQPISSEEESYGLKNLHQRLRLFYGENCGITLRSKNGAGLVIEMIIMKRK